ncbi:conserved exported hypothetical protein [uncultured Dysgonomonas sp.]|uniref:DUF4625 domain-containing protein n=1 Tax=uncultured Dysgonomonas sp. TaxID=206096 RepID=A0A212J7A5_9BACT|nr:DUF4625 domain-containing protein [uncultured Dysgonomonas sp.]SBV95085.1 conserved exported hypothetical protein [uncultured Dysgonomonas sp.]
MRTIIKILFLSIISIITSISFTSCSNDNDGDTTPPVINLTAPTEGAVLKIGSDIHFDMELSDNEMLSSYKVEIHNNFDGHNHTKSLKAEDATTAFAFQKTWSVTGQKTAKMHHHEIIIPENATPGNYHLMVYCTDAAGNESYVARNIVLSHDGEDDDHDHDH